MTEFRPFNYAQSVGAGTQNALAQMQFMGAAKDMKRQNAMEQAFSTAAETGEDPAGMLEKQGFGMEANALRQHAMQQALQGYEWLAKTAPRIKDQRTYDMFRRQAEQFRIAQPGELPEQYDPNLMNGLAGFAQEKWETLTGPRGTLLQRNTQTGQIQQVVGPEGKGTTVNVNQGGNQSAYDEKFSENLAKRDADRADAIFQAADQATSMSGNLDYMESMLNSGLQTGQLEPAKLAIGKLAASLGMNPEAIGINNVSTAEEFNRVATQMGLDALQQFKGATSEKELDVARTTVAGLGTSVEGNRRFIDTMRMLQQRAAARAQMLDQHLQETGGTYRGFNEKWNKYIKANPLFEGGKQAGQRQPGQAAQPQASIPQGAVEMLRKDPSLAQFFDEKYGAGMAQQYLGR